MRTTIIIPSFQRPEVLHETVQSFLSQTLCPEQILLPVPAPEHVDGATLDLPRVRRIIAPAGSSAQRNAGVAHVAPETELVGFFDDDVELVPDYLEWVARAMRARPDVCLLTGAVLADGAKQGSIPRETARRFVRAVPSASPDADLVIQPVFSGYGCNMIVRRGVLPAVQFDERLPLYGWLEDFDFSQRCRRFGGIAQCGQMRLVHLYAGGGRVSGLRYGFSQIMNSFYLYRKGSMPLRKMLVECWTRPVVANLVLSLPPPGAIDRRGRLRGNLIALAHLLRGDVRPEYILEMS
jgi:GT2 family glycosyltransferase